MCHDMDGDGYADLIGFSDNGVMIAYSNGSTFEPSKTVFRGFGFNIGNWSSFEKYPRCVGNFRSPGGLSSIVGFGSAGVYMSHFINRDQFSDSQLVLESFGFIAGGKLIQTIIKGFFWIRMEVF